MFLSQPTLQNPSLPLQNQETLVQIEAKLKWNFIENVWSLFYFMKIRVDVELNLVSALVGVKIRKETFLFFEQTFF